MNGSQVLGLTLMGWSALGAAALGAVLLHRHLRDRRDDRAWEAGIAAGPGGTALLGWLREQRPRWRAGLGCVRTIPAPPDDIELNEWERDEIERMETFWAIDGERQQRRAS